MNINQQPIFETPYYAVIFSSILSESETGYEEMARRMIDLAEKQPGFLGIESVRDTDSGITVSYWRSVEAIKQWKANSEHRLAQELGKSRWYDDFKVRICKVEMNYSK
jgi:heme-degrading monooxygenase HmoA